MTCLAQGLTQGTAAFRDVSTVVAKINQRFIMQQCQATLGLRISLINSCVVVKQKQAYGQAEKK